METSSWNVWWFLGGRERKTKNTEGSGSGRDQGPCPPAAVDSSAGSPGETNTESSSVMITLVFFWIKSDKSDMIEMKWDISLSENEFYFGMFISTFKKMFTIFFLRF